MVCHDMCYKQNPPGQKRNMLILLGVVHVYYRYTWENQKDSIQCQATVGHVCLSVVHFCLWMTNVLWRGFRKFAILGSLQISKTKTYQMYRNVYNWIEIFWQNVSYISDTEFCQGTQSCNLLVTKAEGNNNICCLSHEDFKNKRKFSLNLLPFTGIYEEKI